VAENTRKKAPGAALALALRTGRPSAEAVAMENQRAGRTTDPRGVVGGYLGGGYDPLPVRPGAEQANRDAQTVEYSGTGAPGMVYVNRGGEPVLMPLASARQQGLQIISADVAAQLGQRVVGRESFAGAQASGAPAGGNPAFAGAKASGTPDPRMLAAILRAGR
jgi:hypothetical protein